MAALEVGFFLMFRAMVPNSYRGVGNHLCVCRGGAMAASFIIENQRWVQNAILRHSEAWGAWWRCLQASLHPWESGSGRDWLEDVSP